MPAILARIALERSARSDDLESGRDRPYEIGHAARVRWIFGDQLGQHFLDEADQPVLMIEAKSVFARRRFHRQKAHLVLSAMRHRAAELGDQCRYVRADSYGATVRKSPG